MNPLVSVIIPVYNVEHYIRRCLDSIVSQSFTNIEIILVDDGSPDRSGEICEEYSSVDERFKVIHTPNKGVAEARRIGIEASVSDYIVFVDPDDWLTRDAVEVLYSSLEDNIEIVFGGYNVVAGDIIYTNIETQAGDVIDDLLPLIMMQEVAVSPWAKIYKRSLLNSNSFPKLIKGQDYVMNVKICTKAVKAKFINNIVYNYFEREGATTQSVKYNMDIIMQIIDCVRDILVEANLYEQNIELFKSFAVMNINKIVRDRQFIDRNNESFVRVMNEVKDCLTRKEKAKITMLQFVVGQQMLVMSRKFRGLLKKIR